MFEFFKFIYDECRLAFIYFCFIIILFAYICIHVTQNECKRQHKIYDQLVGKHSVMSLSSNSSAMTTNSSSKFFVTRGELALHYIDQGNIGFYWKDHDGAYNFLQLPLQKVRFAPNDQADIPSVKFRWKDLENYHALSDDNIVYAVVTCKPKDWPFSYSAADAVQAATTR